MAKIMLATGLIVFYGYLTEAFYAWYSGNLYEWFMIRNRAMGPYALFYWSLILCNGLTPQFLWSRKIRTNMVALFILTLVVNIGMWLERFIIVVTSLHRDYMSSSWTMFSPTVWDVAMFVGTLGFFFTGMAVFVKFVPMIPIAEMKHLLHLERHSKHEAEVVEAKA
jgi:molybdopterin-containing oxidoreductase family membrane subunit